MHWDFVYLDNDIFAVGLDLESEAWDVDLDDLVRQ